MDTAHKWRTAAAAWLRCPIALSMVGGCATVNRRLLPNIKAEGPDGGRSVEAFG